MRHVRSGKNQRGRGCRIPSASADGTPSASVAEAAIMEIGEAIKNPAYRIFQTEYSGCLDISVHA